MHYRNVTLSTRVSAAQKAEYVRLAAKYNVSVSEWALTLIEHHKNDYGTIGEPTPKEVKLERALELKNKEIQKLKAQRKSCIISTRETLLMNTPPICNTDLTKPFTTVMNLIML